MLGVRWLFGRCMDCTEEGRDDAEDVSREEGALLDSSYTFHAEKLPANELCTVNSKLDCISDMDQRKCLGERELLDLVGSYSAVSYRGLPCVRGRIQNESDISWRITFHGSAVLEAGSRGKTCTCTLAPRSAIRIIAYRLDEPGLGLEESEIFYKGMPFEGNGKMELTRLDCSTSASATFTIRFGLIDSEVIYFRELAYHEPEPCVRLTDLNRFRTYLRQNGIELGKTTLQVDHERWSNPIIKGSDVNLKDEPALAPICISLLS